MNFKAKRIGIKVFAPLFFLLAVIIVVVIGIYTFAVKNYKESTDSSTISGKPVYQSIHGRNTQEVFEKIKENFLKLEYELSCNTDGSFVDKINSGAGTKWVKTDKGIINILDKALDVSKNSEGLFDVTFYPLEKLWGFESGKAKTPCESEITETLKHVDYNLVNINHSLERVKLEDSLSQICLEGLVDAALCENAINTYKNSGINYGIISVGNIIGSYGKKPDNQYWKISLKDPFDGNTGIGNIKIDGGYVATFGNSSDKLFLNGEKTNKIINPKNGLLPQNGVLSSTVIYPDPIIASALARLCCVTSKETSFKILNHYGAEAIFIASEKNIYVMKNIYDKFNLISSDYNVQPFSV